MKTQSQMDIGLWEKFTDKLSAVSEGVVGFLGSVFGSSNERIVKSLGYIRSRHSEAHAVVPGSTLDQVNALEPLMKGFRDDEFEKLTAEFRRRLGIEHKPLPRKTVNPGGSVAGPAEATAEGPPTVEAPSEAFVSVLDLLEERLADPPTLDDLLPYAFAACRESALRTKNMRHYDVQILGGAVLHQGMIAEMVTGEGKTLVATLPAYLNALEQRGVHVITVNDYLARRDCEWMSPIYHLLGVSCGFIQSDMEAGPRRAAYECDITYGTNSEFGFDYLRDNMKPARWADPDYEPFYQQVQRALNYAIIDEVDNILIDEARTPLIISGPAFGDLRRYAKANEIAVRLTELEKRAQSELKKLGHGINIPDHPLSNAEESTESNGAIQAEATKHKHKSEEEENVDVSKIELPEEGKEKRLGYYFEVKEKERTCHLTDEGVRKAEELAGVESFYTAGNMEWPHLIDNALKAHHLYQKDKQYVVMPHPENKEMSIIIVDEFTGRLMVGRQWSDGLHQAVEAKHAREGVKIKEETQTLATVTLQNFFKLYKKLAGMTGTAMTEANEFWKIYKLDVVAIPTNKPLVRQNYQDVIYMSEKEKWDAVVTEIELMHKWDVVRLKDGTNLIGTIRHETDTTLEIELRDTRERKKLTEDEVDEIQRKGRPMLIGTTDVAKSEKLAAMLKRRGIKHELLNAKPEYAAREAEIVAQAGRTGAVTIATNMAGRGTDIILGGNPEYLAWAKLKDTYATRLDVPDDVWKQTVAEIKVREKMEEEGRQVAEMGGVHIIGTERHEARRIDNQLRGRAGRQGDPGSSRFYLSLEDDLMRIFAGEWVKNVLSRLGMEYGQSIESRMVSRRIEAAQKKVEEKNFDIRKHLLEYDEVMDTQRKRTYGFRQEILNGANCKARVLDMIESQVDRALDRYLADDFGPASFAQLASDRLGIEFDGSDFVRSSFEEAESTAKDRAFDMIATQVHEAMDENLNPDVEAKEWNWQAMANAVNTRWSLKTNDRQLKQIGRDNLAEFIIEQARASILKVDLSKGKAYLDPNWGIKSFCIWAEDKFQVKLDPRQLEERPREFVKDQLMQGIRELYRQREIEFPVTLAMARFMSDKQAAAMHRYDREGLFRWYKARFPGDSSISEEQCRTQSRAHLHDLLVEVSRKSFPRLTHADIDAKLLESFEGAEVSEEGDARELCEWVRQNLGLEFNAEDLTGVTRDQARDILWNAYDRLYRPEMRKMERSLVLNQLDLSWKNHLYAMDHLRQGIGLVGYAQIDPKTEFKRQGMKEFDAMWESLEDKLTNIVFRMEDDESFQESVWSIGAMVHEEAPTALSQSMRAQQDAAIIGSQQTEKKVEPIRNRQQKVGRNDPCPCGSGKKYKNCCMRSMAR